MNSLIKMKIGHRLLMLMLFKTCRIFSFPWNTQNPHISQNVQAGLSKTVNVNAIKLQKCTKTVLL